MEMLISVNQMSLNFNLREPRGNKCTNVYAVVKCGSVQFKLPIGAKVNTWQWNAKQQLPAITSTMSENDIENNKQVIDIINQIRFGYINYFSYICSSQQMTTAKEVKESVTNIIKEITNKDMANNKNLQRGKSVKATTLLKQAFNIYYTELHSTTKESSKKSVLEKLNAFTKYCEEVGKDGKGMLSQTGVNDYKTYLIKNAKENGNSNKEINNKCKTIVRLINDVLSIDNRFSKYNIASVKYINLEEVNVKGESKMRRPLTQAEINTLINANNLTPKEKEYRDIFILQCECGYRASDTEKMFNEEEQKRYTENGKEYIVITPKKEEKKGVKSIILVTDIVRQILDKYKTAEDFKYIKFKETFETNYNRCLKKIFEKCGLNSIENYINNKGEKESKPLNEIISSHFARYTFIRICFDKGMSESEVIKFSGHANEQMIKEVYLIINEKDRIKSASRTIERIYSSKQNSDGVRVNITAQNINEQNDLIKEVKEALFCLGADLNELADINDYHELNVLLYCKYHAELEALGIAADAKKVYKLDTMTLAEKRKEIKTLKELIIAEMK